MVTSGQLPVLSDVENFVFYCTKRFAMRFQGESLGRFSTSIEVDMLNFKRFITRVTDKDASVKMSSPVTGH